MALRDTHVLVALRAGDARLGRRARQVIEKASLKREVAVSAISFWEVAMLVAARRLRFTVAIASWRRAVFDAGVVEIPLGGRIGIRAAELLPIHPDPADGIILATAALADAQLYTADRALLEHELTVTTLDATR